MTANIYDINPFRAGYEELNTHKIHSERWQQRVKTFDKKLQSRFTQCILITVSSTITPPSLTIFAATCCATKLTDHEMFNCISLLLFIVNILIKIPANYKTNVVQLKHHIYVGVMPLEFHR